LTEGHSLVGTPAAPTYAYLLGLYLGDGYLAATRRGVFHLRITLDARYPGVVAEAARAVSEILPNRQVAVYPHRGGANAEVVGCYSKSWPNLFPQHGPGPKHTRRIELEGWQRDITTMHPRPLIRGLVQSDGSRFVAAQRIDGRTYRYTRYCFNNRSQGILRIFCDHLDVLGIQWTMSRQDQVQIARRDSVKELDTFVGPKR
jgi:hypothetical protein